VSERPAPPSSARRITADEETRRDTQAALAARRELGPEYDEHIAASLADRVEQLAAYRTAELRQQTQVTQAETGEEKSARTQRFVLGIVSLGAGIPITAISSHESGLLGLAVAWAGIVGVNAVHALTGRSRRRP